MSRPTPVLKRFDTFVYKDKDPLAVPPDRAQIPASGATVDFYLQGATASENKTILAGQEASLLVYHPGMLAVTTPFQTVQIEANGIVILEVKNVVLATAGFGATVTLKNTHSTDSAVIAAKNRLILLTNRPKIYDDPAAAAAAPGSSQTTAGSDGRALGYLREYRFDYIVTIDATTSRVFVDDEGSFVMR